MYQELPTAPGLIGRWGLNEATGTTAASTAPARSERHRSSTAPAWAAGYPFSADNTPPAHRRVSTAAPGTQRSLSRWTANTEADLAGYNVYRSTTSPVALQRTAQRRVPAHELPASRQHGLERHDLLLRRDRRRHLRESLRIPRTKSTPHRRSPTFRPLSTPVSTSRLHCRRSDAEPDRDRIRMAAAGPLSVTWTSVIRAGRRDVLDSAVDGNDRHFLDQPARICCA